MYTTSPARRTLPPTHTHAYTHAQAGSQTCQHSEPHAVTKGHTLTRTRLAQLLSHLCHYWMVFEALAGGKAGGGQGNFKPPT